MLEIKRGLIRVSVMKTVGAVVAVLLAGVLVLPAGPAKAQGTGVRVAQAGPADAPPPVRRVPRLRVYPNYEGVPEVYPRYFPGPNAVRECNATYVQEYRPSGTVIVPRMHCFWRPG
jgi:lipoprotein-anchoring transpeptidase ErfK/SrfK